MSLVLSLWLAIASGPPALPDRPGEVPEPAEPAETVEPTEPAEPTEPTEPGDDSERRGAEPGARSRPASVTG